MAKHVAKEMAMTPTETHPDANHGVPRPVLMAAAALLTFAFLASSFVRFTGVGAVHMPVVASAQVVRLHFLDRTDGGVDVLDADDGHLIYTVAPGTNGFIRATLRGLARERMREGVGEAPPFTLTRWQDGTISLEDTSIGRRIDLDAFGPANAGAFVPLFATRR